MGTRRDSPGNPAADSDRGCQTLPVTATVACRYSNGSIAARCGWATWPVTNNQVWIFYEFKRALDVTEPTHVGQRVEFEPVDTVEKARTPLGWRPRTRVRLRRPSPGSAATRGLHGAALVTDWSSGAFIDMVSPMTKEQVKKVLDRVLTWPPERQADLAQRSTIAKRCGVRRPSTDATR